MSTQPKALRLADELKKFISYDQDTGLFLWLKTRSRTAKAGMNAGSQDNHGYINIMFQRKMHKAHRLAWLYIYGSYPDGQIDHINGDRLDNRISNLRVVSNKQNQENIGSRTNNTSGYRGVSLNKKSGKYEAHIRHNGKKHHLGFFFSIDEAARVAISARKDLMTHNDRWE